jgi:hypothetical protein
MELTTLDELKLADSIICKNIDKKNVIDEGLLAQNVFSQLRDIIEFSALLIFCHDTHEDLPPSKKNIGDGIKYMKSHRSLDFLKYFYSSYERVGAHLRERDEETERLICRYMGSLLQLKKYLLDNLDISILSNIKNYPLDMDTDRSSVEYYKQVKTALSSATQEYKTDRFYALKSKPIFFNNTLFFENTLMPANDHATKFDRVLAYSLAPISSHYAIKAIWSKTNISFLSSEMTVMVVKSWEVAVRGCEFEHLLEMLCLPPKVSTNSSEYIFLMKRMTDDQLIISDLMDYSSNDFNNFVDEMGRGAKEHTLVDALKTCYCAWNEQKTGRNLLRYTLFSMNNKFVKNQLVKQNSSKRIRGCDYCITSKSWMFDKMPFSYCPYKHKTSLLDLLECFGSKGYENQVFERRVSIKINEKRRLYLPFKDLDGLEENDILKKVQDFNAELSSKVLNSEKKLCVTDSHFLVVQQYENETYAIINIIRNHAILPSSAQRALIVSSDIGSDLLDGEDKKRALNSLFIDSCVEMISGPAGTGKTYFINLVARKFSNAHKIFLANTNSAVAVLRNKITAPNSVFMTAEKFLSGKNNDFGCDILFIDEGSTIDNRTMNSLLLKCHFTFLVIAGDDYQIESIDFGNWFSLLPFFLPKSAVIHFDIPYRAFNEDLRFLWQHVRSLGGKRCDGKCQNLDETKNQIFDDDVLDGYSHCIDESMFNPKSTDEIILCLSYGGPYGVNCINQLLQSRNKNGAVSYKTWTFKKGDPILFNESSKFSPILYNNLKGKIIDIADSDSNIVFDLNVEKAITQSESSESDVQIIEPPKKGMTHIRISFSKIKENDDEDNSGNDVIPFQLAYAVTIDKAQGMEFDSVKIVVTKESEKTVTKNVFYTAITRARSELTIFWAPQVEKEVISGFCQTPGLSDDAAKLKKNYPSLSI